MGFDGLRARVVQYLGMEIPQLQTVERRERKPESLAKILEELGPDPAQAMLSEVVKIHRGERSPREMSRAIDNLRISLEEIFAAIQREGRT